MATALDPDRPVRWGILGAGAVARSMGADIAASVHSVVQAVAARDVGRAAALADVLGAGTGYGSYAELAADPDVDVVYVATTHGQHYPQVRDLLDAGKAVLVEKSFTVNADQAAVLAELAHERRLFCMEAMWTRCLPIVRGAVEASTRIGRIVGLRTDLSRRVRYDPSHRMWDPATGGGVALDMGVYVAHIAWAFLGAPESVRTTGRRSPHGVDATLAMQWAYPDGSFAHVTASFDGVSDGPHTVVTGERGWVAMHGRTHEPARVVVHVDGDEQETTAVHVGNGYGAQVTEVERALREGETGSPLVPMSDTVGVLRILDAARRTLGVHYGAIEEV